MPAYSRRRFLHSAAGATAILAAGCTGDSGPRPDDAPETDPRWDEEDYITTFEISEHRLEREIARQERVLEYKESDEDSPPGGPRWPYVIDEDDVDQLSFRIEPNEVGEAWEFLRQTDYDESSVFIAERRVRGCQRLELMYVERRGGTGDRLAGQFCSVLRDPSVECSEEEMHTQLTLVRVPVVYDDPPSGWGGGGSSSCRLPPDHPAHPEADE